MHVHSARFVAGAASPKRLPPETLPEVALAGRSNVGKSSLLNRLVGRHGLARVSKRPGRTQQLNFFEVNDALRLVDLPGYGFAKVPRTVQDEWKALVEHYLTRRRVLVGAVVIIDLRRGVEADDALLLDFPEQHATPAILAATKVDKLGRGERTRLMRALAESQPDVPCLACSGVTGEGMPELWEAICALTKPRGAIRARGR